MKNKSDKQKKIDAELSNFDLTGFTKYFKY